MVFFNRIDNLRIIFYSDLKITWSLERKRGKMPSKRIIYNKYRNILYIFKDQFWEVYYQDQIAHELSKIFGRYGSILEYNILFLIEKGFTNDEIHERFLKFKIPKEVIKGAYGEIDIDPKRIEGYKPKRKVLKIKKKKDSPLELHERKETHVNKVGEHIEEELYTIEELEEIASKKYDTPKEDGRRIGYKPKLKKPKKDKSKKRDKPKEATTISTADVENLAIEWIIYVESQQGNKLDRVEDQKRIGYDIDSEYRKIEVKSSRGSLSTITLEPHEWRACQELGDEYYIYVVEGLKKGNEPSIQVIENPSKTVNWVPKGRIQLVNWRDKISETIYVPKLREDKENGQNNKE